MRKLHTIAEACLLSPKTPFQLTDACVDKKVAVFYNPSRPGEGRREREEEKKKTSYIYRVRDRLAGECFSYHQEVEEAVKNLIYLFALTAPQSIARCVC